ncbi:MAG: EF-hand domain-containing protein [Proteobacteria bacterium]|nr:MAG: EF-hand domain-containing protein [Pseudomonadota bacterium]
MSTLSPEEIAEIRDHFEFFDRDESGQIDQDEFIQLLKILAPNADRQNAIRGFETIDDDNNEKIDFEEFLSWWQTNWTVF